VVADIAAILDRVKILDTKFGLESNGYDPTDLQFFYKGRP